MATNKFNVGDLVIIAGCPYEFWIIKDFIQRGFYNEFGENLYFEYYLENFQEKNHHRSVHENFLKLKNHLKEFL
jgi:hypothetical protein